MLFLKLILRGVNTKVFVEGGGGTNVAEWS